MEGKTIAERMHEGFFAQSHAEEAIFKAWGEDENPAGVVTRISSDYYDNSLEIFLEPHIGDEGKADEARQQVVLGMGFSRFWVNWTDGTEQYGTGERRLGVRARIKEQAQVLEEVSDGSDRVEAVPES